MLSIKSAHFYFVWYFFFLYFFFFLILYRVYNNIVAYILSTMISLLSMLFWYCVSIINMKSIFVLHSIWIVPVKIKSVVNFFIWINPGFTPFFISSVFVLSIVVYGHTGNNINDNENPVCAYFCMSSQLVLLESNRNFLGFLNT